MACRPHGGKKLRGECQCDGDDPDDQRLGRQPYAQIGRRAKVEGTYVDWDKVDCPYEPVRDWQKFLKRGLGRTTFQASKDVREGLITREEALRLVKKYDGKRPKALDSFLKETGMTENEFNELTSRNIVKSPAGVK